HYVWADARPRAGIGTLEVRPACQQPAELSWVPSAFSLGVVEAAEDAEAFIEDSLGSDSWSELMRYRERAVRLGISAPEPVGGFLEGLLDLSWEGLLRRGRGEEEFLKPAREILELREGPADTSRRAFERGGVRALISERAVN
ncbi:MAG: hypothetical protein ACRDSJ_07390, partial [Rubrobacteraceae bacterium]